MRLAHVKSVLLSVGIHAIIGISGPSCRHRDGERFELKKFLRVRVPLGSVKTAFETQGLGRRERVKTMGARKDNGSQ